MGPLHHQVAATMVPLLAARPIASTADFRCFGPRLPLLINHLPGENRRKQGRIGEVGLVLRRQAVGAPRATKRRVSHTLRPVAACRWLGKLTSVNQKPTWTM